MYEVITKLPGTKKVIKTLYKSAATAERKARDANEAGLPSTWRCLF